MHREITGEVDSENKALAHVDDFFVLPIIIL
jgi:hypothetical protein